MKKIFAILLTLVMVVGMFAGCDIDHSQDTTTGPAEVITDPTDEVVVDATIDTTEAPTEENTEEVTEEVTEEPTEEPTEAPTEEVTEEPTEAPETGNSVPVHQHSYSRKVTAEPTCTIDGEAVHTCSCGASYTETIAKTGHNWELYYSTATCTNGGTAHYTCACGATYEKEVPKNDHVWGEWVVTKEPTTTECGYKWRTCQLCNGGQQATIDPLPADDGGNTGNANCANGQHNWVKIVDVEATCSSTGRYHSECSVCGEPGLICTIGMADHEYSEWSEWVQGEHEKTRTKTCVNCGHTVTESIQTSHDCSKDGHTISAADRAKIENWGDEYRIYCICGEFNAFGKTRDEALAELNAHAAEKWYNDCGDIYFEGWGHRHYIPAYICTVCGESRGNYSIWQSCNGDCTSCHVR